MTKEEAQVASLLVASGSAPELRLLRGWEYADKIWLGGMGAVALLRNAEGPAALKFVLPEYATEEISLALFEREVANMRALRHKNIVELYGAGVYEQSPFFLMEFCAGGSAWDLGKRSGALTLGQATAITLQILDALEYAHQAEIPNVPVAGGNFASGRSLVHRDIKPHNILLADPGPDAVAKLADYGLAKARSLAGVSELTLTGDARGTVAFMPRQQLANYKYAGPEVDIWATAASLYWMLTLRTPRNFGAADPFNVVRNTAPVPIMERGVAVPASVAEVVDQALDDSASLRFQSAGEFREALENALRGTDAESSIRVG
jgi:serine/threonine protein kinase